MVSKVRHFMAIASLSLLLVAGASAQINVNQTEASAKTSFSPSPTDRTFPAFTSLLMTWITTAKLPQLILQNFSVRAA